MRHKRVMTFEEADKRCMVLSSAWGVVAGWRTEVRHAGAKRAAAALSRALKSVDGAIRHAQRMRNEAERRRMQ